MNPTEQTINNEKNRMQIQEINSLIERARLERGQNLGLSNNFLEKAYEIADQIAYKAGKGHSLRELAVNFLQVRLYKNAVKTLEQASQFFMECGEMVTYHKCMNELSDMYYLLGDYELALETLFSSLKVPAGLEDKLLVAEIYNKVGAVYKIIGEYQKAIEQHLQALAIYEKSGDATQVSVANYYIGNCYNWADELDVAYNYLEKSLKAAQSLRDQSLKIRPLGSLAILFTKNKNYAKAEEYFFLAIDAVEHTSNLKLKAGLLKSLGNLYLEQKFYPKAISALEEALEISTKLDVKTPTNQVHLYLSNAYERTGDFQKALEHLKRFSEISREITNEEIAIKTKGIQLKFDMEEFRKQKELAEHSARLKDRFLSTISHELRTPLNGVLGMANLLADTHPSPEQLEYINTIKLSTNNLIGIIDDILDFSRIKAGEVKLKEEKFNLAEFLTGLAQSVKSKADQKQLKFTLLLQPGLPAYVVADKERLSQVLMNLLSNAVKYTLNGKVSLDVSFKPLDSGTGRFRFTVSDTGIGISEKRVPGIFENFAREDEEHEKTTEGTGLGLAIARQLVELLKGSISVKSKLQEGSEFTVELNLPCEGPLAEIGGTAKPVLLRNLAEVSILLVDDNKVNQFLGKQILSRLGFQVQLAGNGKDALELIEKENFDLVLMDVNMPVMNGYDLTQLIRKQLLPPKNGIPIIALTAYASSAEKERAYSIGMNDYVTKPYSPQELLNVIMKQLNLKHPDGLAVTETELPPSTIQQQNESRLLNHIREMMQGNEDDLRKMVAMYLEQIPAINNLIKEAIQAKNWEEVYQQSHKMKSSVKLLNQSRMTELITMIEEYAKSGENTEVIGALFEAFKKECKQAMLILQNAIH